jgi:hypothetical protein
MPAPPPLSEPAMLKTLGIKMGLGVDGFIKWEEP